MALTNIQKVRSKMGDLVKISVNELVAKGDGIRSLFQLDMAPISTGSVDVRVSGVAIASASAVVNFSLGTVDLTAAVGNLSPTAGAEIRSDYQYFALSNDEVQDCIDLASGGGTLMAAAIGLRSIAGSQARLFSYTQGSKTVDKDNIGPKLMKLAESFEKAKEVADKGAGTTLTISSFDDSGTPFEGFDTATAELTTGTFPCQ